MYNTDLLSSPRSLEHALILGGSGFMGSALGRRLEQANGLTSYLVHARPLRRQNDRQRLHHGSLSRFDWRTLAGEKPDVIYHFARIPGKGRFGRLVAGLQSARANSRLLQWLESQPQPPLLVLIAGTLSYGSHGHEWITEDTPYRPTSFAREYSLGEAPIVAAARRQRIPVQIMRPSWVYGPESWFKSYYLKPMLQSGIIPRYGDGSAWMSLIHVEDTAAMIHYLSMYGTSGENYNLFIGEPWTQVRFVQELQQLTRLPVQPVAAQELLRRYGRVVAEAFAFSLRVSTKHKALYAGFQAKYPDHRQGLADLLSAPVLADRTAKPARPHSPAAPATDLQANVISRLMISGA